MRYSAILIYTLYTHVLQYIHPLQHIDSIAYTHASI